MTAPWNVPVDTLQPDANNKVKELGELARALVAFDLICLEHGVFAHEIQEKHLEREEARHRIGEMCWHQITRVNTR